MKHEVISLGKLFFFEIIVQTNVSLRSVYANKNQFNIVNFHLSGTEMQSSVILGVLCLSVGFSYTICGEVENENDRCEIIMRRIVSDDRKVATDNTPSRLHSTWVSQECEVRAGPKYITRKYSFFKNGSFLLLQFHYAEESCSIATYNVLVRGSIEILSSPTTVPGATKASVELDSVHLIPLNRQVAHKFGRKMNASCGGIDTKWRPYLAQLIYERPTGLNTSLQMHDLQSNSLQSRLLRTRKRYTMDCLESFGIEFTELRLLRVEVRTSNFATNSSIRDSINEDKMHAGVELFLGGLARNVHLQRIEPRPNRLQTTSLVRADTIINCPVCTSIFRATEYNPPLFHQAPSLPAVIGGLWLSIKCESVDGGLWSRRFFQIYSNGNKWFARWTYYADSTCSNTLYTLAAAGTYIQRALRQTRNAEYPNAKLFHNDARLDKLQEELEVGVYRHVLDDADRTIMLGGNHRQKINRHRFNARHFPSFIRRGFTVPSGTTELKLHVLESLLIPVDKTVLSHCLRDTKVDEIMRMRRAKAQRWTKSCVPRAIEAPATVLFKAKISLDWNGEYTLFLASWKDDIWEAPLHRCSGRVSRYDVLRQSWHQYLSVPKNNNWREQFNSYRQYWFSSSFASCPSIRSPLFNWIILLLCLCCTYFDF